jgi:hypothetical protein
MASVSGPDQNLDESTSQHDAVESGHFDARQAEREKLRTSRFDVVTSFFLALILFIGTFVLMLFIVWLTSRWTFPPRALEPIIEQAAGRGDNAEGFERDFEPPGAEEVEELQEPTLQDTIEAVTDAVSSVAASFTTSDTSATATTAGTGQGDSRPPGPEGEGEDVVPRFERWQLEFTARDVGIYAKQLDSFGIELGVVGGSVQGLDIASELSKNPQARHVDDASSEKRLYFMFTTASQLKQFDLQLLQRAGINTAGRELLKFIPKDLENVTLANLEMDYAKSKGHTSVTEIARTVFQCQPDGGSYRFVVTSQRYRKARK